jgi:hypothetical protein
MNALSGEAGLVYTLQGYLQAHGYYKLKLDGDFGPATSEAVSRFKRVHGMNDRDWVGPRTWQLLSSDDAIKWQDATPAIPVDVSLPPMLREARKHLGLREIPGSKSNQTILDWAKDGGIGWYKNDDTPWCGLFHLHLGLTCHPELTPPPNPLSARNWGGRDVINGVFKSASAEPGWGEKGPDPSKGESVLLGSTGVMWRTSKANSWHGHIGIVFAQNSTHIGLVGGNQNNSVSEAWYPRSSFLGTRIAQDNLPEAPTARTGTTGASMT